MATHTLLLDVREDIRRGREPFSKIMQAVASLGPGQDMVLIAPFEPAPLYGILSQQGFNHATEATPEGDFRVTFSRSAGKTATGERVSQEAASPACGGVPVVEVDARGLEPPQPMVKILEALSTLPVGAQIRAHTDRRPMHLYSQLEQRGFSGKSQEQSDGSFVTTIQRATGR